MGSFEDNAIDAFGDAYEYLMQMYASQAGKSGGEYFAPQEALEVLARIAVGDKKRIGKRYEAFQSSWIQIGGSHALTA